ncbi:MAG: hypothetical protein HRT61_22135, partial [Ekhidna sp.]|nr:hypothetical protein [Ekhidna sp.]
KESLATQIKSLLKSVRFSACYVDVFPNGILGELSDSIIDASCFHYLGRRLRWEQYLPLFDEPIHFETAFLFEELEEAHFSYIASHSSSVLEVELGYGSADPSFDHPLISQEKPIWLIVHSSNVQEVTMLVDHAVDVASIEQVQPHFVVLSKEELNRSDVTILTDQDPIDWFPIADRIFSGAGFNTWNQLTSWREKHVCLPLQRRFDDQYWRSQQ